MTHRDPAWSPYAPDDPQTLRVEDLELLHDDDDLLAVSKPPGLLVHRGWGRDEVTLVDLLKPLMPQGVYPIHRLDRATSGVLLLARHADAARAINAQLDQGQLRKRYLMLTRGHAPPCGWIDHPLPRREDGPRVPSFTAYRCLHHATTSPRVTSLVEASPITGRPHQLRRHMSFINHPLIADARYGKASLNHDFRQNYNLWRLALHASSLSLIHPATQLPLTLRAPLAPDLLHAWTAMGIDPALWRDAIAQDDTWVRDLIPPLHELPGA